MKKEYYLVHKAILPDCIDQVIEARTLLENHEVSSVKEAVTKVGISRNTYYKYKDYVFEKDTQNTSRQAVLTLILKDEKGSLASVIQTLSEIHTSILTISQALPVARKANVLITLDITHMNATIEELTSALKTLSCVRSVHLDAIE
ncbi:MAG: ACT domain-containing protein [Solobacterium sp.]|nr:ACT domain-containing protein [Solobacterium sp.]